MIIGVARVGEKSGGGLGRVHGTAAANANHKRAAFTLRQAGGFLRHGHGGLALHKVEDVADAFAGKQLEQGSHACSGHTRYHKCAAAQRCCERSAKASWSAREILNSAATLSAVCGIECVS